MQTRTEWTCPGCQKKYAVPSTDGLTVCPACAAAIASPQPAALEMTEIEFPEADVPASFPEFDKTEPTPARPSRRRQHGPFGFVVLVASWVLGMYLAWSGYLFLGKPKFVFREDAVRWILEIHRDKGQPIILPLWRHR
ncbi:MAG: hypothetical protein H7062_05650 [Candidatus Saccharimonas sp.]|nr:hypothetical protein [Planctomycetaceae bacterium]